MKNLIVFVMIVFVNFSYSKSNFINKEKRILKLINNSEKVKLQEEDDYELLTQMMNAVNYLQEKRKNHYLLKYNKKYNEKYNSDTPNKKNWLTDLDNINDYLSQNIALYNEQYQRCYFYSWISSFPKDLYKKFDINNLPKPKDKKVLSKN